MFTYAIHVYIDYTFIHIAFTTVRCFHSPRLQEKEWLARQPKPCEVCSGEGDFCELGFVFVDFRFFVVATFGGNMIDPLVKDSILEAIVHFLTRGSKKTPLESPLEPQSNFFSDISPIACGDFFFSRIPGQVIGAWCLEEMELPAAQVLCLREANAFSILAIFSVGILIRPDPPFRRSSLPLGHFSIAVWV